ncbi:14840_t:CDS:2, partial [Cetraspora pellucida]
FWEFGVAQMAHRENMNSGQTSVYSLKVDDEFSEKASKCFIRE